ncbi:hypothetical protein PsYK624_154660 [Phanerochaete sordida]|uniref:DUF6533 domain-containing protein n=1 Tax=Phanerochaete sordida TaxID=48140 RepID=A0A9P3GPL5_9APHY|nr:hypothetical protein PsYK624_154660 [Phanerochaete sordida]
MADASSDDIHTLELFVASQYINCSILCLVAYEYAITFGREVRCIWMRKLSATSLLLLSIRWTMVLSQVLVWIPFLSSRTTCAVYYVLRELLLFSTYAQIALFSGLRVCALWNGSPYRYLHLFCILMLGFVPIWTNVFRWSRTTISWTGAPYYTCSVPADLPLNVVNAGGLHEDLCYRRGRHGLGADMDQDISALEAVAPSSQCLVCRDSAVARWHSIFSRTSSHEHCAGDNVLGGE